MILVQKMSLNVEAVIGGHEDWVHSTEWNNDGTKLVTASSDKTAIVWEEQNEMWSDTVGEGKRHLIRFCFRFVSESLEDRQPAFSPQYSPLTVGG